MSTTTTASWPGFLPPHRAVPHTPLFSCLKTSTWSVRKTHTHTLLFCQLCFDVRGMSSTSAECPCAVHFGSEVLCSLSLSLPFCSQSENYSGSFSRFLFRFLSTFTFIHKFPSTHTRTLTSLVCVCVCRLISSVCLCLCRTTTAGKLGRESSGSGSGDQSIDQFSSQYRELCQTNEANSELKTRKPFFFFLFFAFCADFADSAPSLLPPITFVLPPPPSSLSAALSIY